MHRPVFFACLCAIVSAVGCGSHRAAVGSDVLPVRRVVIYRNGVAYFERSGKLDGEALGFDVRREDVGDFLSSLTLIERTRQGVRSVSFQVPEPPPSAPRPVRTTAPEPEPSTEEEPPPEEEPPERMHVELRFDGDGEHDLTAAYVVAAPIWRPSYRVVLDEGDQALLQAWAIVQNTSGEDWEDVSLSLTTGAPIAFRSDLGTPIVPRRPMVSDRGEVVMAVPGSETALAQEPRNAPPAPAPSAASAAAPESLELEEEGAVARRKAATARRSGGADGDAALADEAPSVSAGGVAGSVQRMAAIAVLGEGVTRYDVRERVTVPDGGSTMVAVLSQRVPGEAAYLFAPDGGVPNSHVHPFRVVRLVNRSAAILERGPVAVFGDETFLGQGLLETLPRGATAFVPFAVDKSLVVEQRAQHREAEGKLVRVTRDRVVVERFSERLTAYQVRNGGAEAAKVYLRHPRWRQADLLAPPEGSELTPGKALLPLQVPGRGTATLEVKERTPVKRSVDFMSEVAAEAIALYLEGPAVTAAHAPVLRRALELRTQLLQAQQRIEREQAERKTLQAQASETRENLASLEHVEARDLEQRLVKRLGDLESRIASATERIVEAETTASELRVRLSEVLQDVTLVTEASEAT